ncbi:hypothetical protein EG349_02435 [Chryseobacterium shandongense]|uniref:GNAT family N-acetyltransferase n=1 Tax=Chryseobacterium shandongense TaxID=1493872 RepID=A0AAD1DM29_9FLAO|nr:hypothetical protein [Chryseobacterium shandongense]AZA85729.1 hypothetical protein EG349_02435 [Chryseobacterium shandongense]AZA94135.1 hypothetical protein EG353_00470 [Chryseobacterium shandongense]
MIRRVKYKDIDFQKYTKCIQHSVQKNWYAGKEVLDELCGNWEVLVYEDYKAVLPVPLKKKLGLNFVIMPLFCQQLGVFSEKDNCEINDNFLQFLKRNYKVFLYSFNHHNSFSENLEKKKNYTIPVSDYILLRRKKYFKGRKSTAKCAQHLIYKEIELNQEHLSFIEKNFKGLKKETDIKKFKDYLYFLNNNHSLKLSAAYLEERLINVAVLVNESTQLSLLGLINDESYKAENGPSFLIDKILDKYIHQKEFNFMGSNIRGIEIFFKSFGGELQEYPYLQSRILKKLS